MRVGGGINLEWAVDVLKTHCGYQLGGFVVIKLEAQWLLKLKLSLSSEPSPHPQRANKTKYPQVLLFKFL
jgi:hypothetical protein